MELPTYTSIWRIEKRLYKLYDFRLPMPLPVGQIAVFVAITVPYIVLLTLFGLPFNHNLFWLYVLPPGLFTWLATRPVLESKRLPELIISQTRYIGEPSTWCRLAPLAENDEIVVFGRVWRRADLAAVLSAEQEGLEQDGLAQEGLEQREPARGLPVPVRAALPVAAAAQGVSGQPVAQQRVDAQRVELQRVAQQRLAGQRVAESSVRGRAGAGRRDGQVRERQAGEQQRQVREREPTGLAQGQRSRETPEGPGTRWSRRAAGTMRRQAASGAAVPGSPLSGQIVPARDAPRPPAADAGWTQGAGPIADAAVRRDAGAVAPPRAGRHAGPARPAAVVGYPADTGGRPGGTGAEPRAGAGAGGAGTIGHVADAGAEPDGPAPDSGPSGRASAGWPAGNGAGTGVPPGLELARGTDQGPRAAAGTGWPNGHPAAAIVPTAAAAQGTGPAADAGPGGDAGPAVDVRPARRSADPVPFAPPSAGPKPFAPPSIAPQPSAPHLAGAGQPAAPHKPRPPAPPDEPRPAAPVAIVPAQRSAAGPPPAAPAQPRPAPVEGALSGPGERRSTGWHGHVTVVSGGRGPGRPDHVTEARSRAMLPLDRPRLVVVLGCTVGAGQTVTSLMLADLLAGLRAEPVAALDLNPGPASLTELAGAAAITVSALLAGRAPGAHAAQRGPAGPARGNRTGSRLDVICQDADLNGSAAMPALQFARLAGVLASRYTLTLADPGAPSVAKLLAEAGQLVLVAPASPDAARAVSMTCEWLTGHGHAALAKQSIAVLNGVSQRSVRHSEQAELVLRGRCRAIVRVPWDDHLAEPGAERGIRDSLAAAGGQARLAQLRPAVLQAYTALAGVLVSSLADDPARRGAAR